MSDTIGSGVSLSIYLAIRLPKKILLFCDTRVRKTGWDKLREKRSILMTGCNNGSNDKLS